ncbi:src-like-adapter [Astyanax mexicanus]|uniref:Src-like-adapter n=1 Tax=Astyanax mexicanus TaxID=7994 RepID=A0A8T2M6R2_ASTMX|nr:src-like-adapter [Astyanax mexicanus]KAG9276631.1 src-like-adapter [Astyanax mexicanus]
MGNTQASLQRSTENFSQTTSVVDLPSRVSEKEAAMVLSDYPASDVCEPIFHAGEWLRVLSDDGYWLKVYSIQTREENYIPNSHAAKVYHGWLFEGVERVKAEELLRLPGNRVGSFLIRVSRRGTYALSVRHRVIMHYRIFRLPNNWYFISPRLTFQCLEDLVSHYSDVADGLCCVLTGPCLAAPDPSQNLPSLPARMGRSWNFNRGAGDSAEHFRQNTSDLAAHRDSGISFGVQNSVSTYLSLAGVQEKRKPSWKRKKWRSIYMPSSQQVNNTAIEEESYDVVA